MRFYVFFIIYFFSILSLSSQTYNISSGGSVSTCSGTFYDPGGTGNYGNNQNYTMTFCPSTAGQVIQVTFTSFDLELDYDYLYIYDGNNTSAPLLGQFSGTPSLGTIKATVNNATGCLTFKFVSDGGTYSSGWVATIACTSSPASAMYLISTGGTISTCGGTFYDPGGPNCNYTNDLDHTITFCPSTSGKVIQVSFSSFNTENYSSTYDRLFIYDGNSTSASLIGSYAGSSSPGTINVTGSNSSGCLTFRFRSDDGTTGSGWVATISCVDPPPPIVNMTNGSYTVCSATFYDSGGSGSDYSNNENSTVVFCPSTAGQCISANFSSFSLESNFDFLSVFDGNSTSAKMILGSSFTGGTSPGNIRATTTNTSGCLTFKFVSDGGTKSSGWAATISCSPCATPPSTYAAQDCYGGITICSGASFSGVSQGPGQFNDANLGLGNLGCLNSYGGTPDQSGEHQSSWYFFSPATGGTIGMLITPQSSSTDYDWAIWGPYTSAKCAPTGSPIRCSAASKSNSSGAITGMGNGASDTDEGSGGNGYVSTMNVNAGQVYVMLLDNWNATSAPFTLSWQLTNGATLSCAVLAVELTSFSAEKKENFSQLNWECSSEVNNNYFIIERSFDGVSFEEIGKVKGAGTTMLETKYSFKDISPSLGNNYYRLKQVEYSGIYKYSEIRIVNFSQSQILLNNIHPNPTNQDLYFDFYTTEKSQIDIQLFDQLGRVLLKESDEVNEGKNELKVQISQIPAGVYFMRVTHTNSGLNNIQKIIKN